MNIVERLQRLETLIVEHTHPPVTAILRSEIALCSEEAEAHAQRGAKQDHTLAIQIETIETQAKTIATLRQEKQDADSELAKIKAEDLYNIRRARIEQWRIAIRKGVHSQEFLNSAEYSEMRPHFSQRVIDGIEQRKVPVTVVMTGSARHALIGMIWDEIGKVEKQWNLI